MRGIEIRVVAALLVLEDGGGVRDCLGVELAIDGLRERSLYVREDDPRIAAARWIPASEIPLPRQGRKEA